MRTVTWISPELARAVHDRLAAEHGGTGGVRDPQALADVLSAVAASAAPGRPDLFALAAGYAAEVVARRPFAGANVRAALAVAETFLSLNGVPVAAADVDLVLAMRRLAAGQITRAELAACLADRHDLPPAGRAADRSPVSPGRRPPMATFDYQCSRCGGTAGEPGSVHSTGGIYFRPANSKFLTLRTGDIPVRANACPQCGHVDLVADVDKLSTLTRRAEPV